jgi:hypothetical protein
MRNLFRTKNMLLCLMALVLVVVTASAFGAIDIGAAGYQFSGSAIMAMAAAPIAVGAISTQELDALKLKYGEIKIIECGTLKGYFRKPDLKLWKFAIKAMEKSATEFKKSLAINCFVAGDKLLLQSPILEDVAEIIDEFITYTDAEIEKDGNAWVVKVLDKSCRLKPINIEMQALAERNNPDDIAFLTQQNLLDFMWIEGDPELKNSKLLEYHMPVLRVLKQLRKKHILSVKNA